MNNEWNYDIIKEHASHYKTKNEFKKYDNLAYNYAKRYNLLDEIMPLTITFWTEDKVTEESKKYKTRNEFKHGNNSAYNYARKHNMLNVLYKK